MLAHKLSVCSNERFHLVYRKVLVQYTISVLLESSGAEL